MTLLDRDLHQPDDPVTDWAQKPRRAPRLAGWAAVLLTGMLIAAVAVAVIARRDNARALADLARAREAVDASLAAADRDPVRAAADIPEFQTFRRDVLANAERFYAAFLNRPGRFESSRSDLAFAHLRLGQINRMRGKSDEAAREYREAIEMFQELVRSQPEQEQYRAALAVAFNSLGETLRAVPSQAGEAELAYGSAIDLQRRLGQDGPQGSQHLEELAAIHYNRGTLRALKPGGAADASSDLREAARLLEPLSASNDRLTQELARVYGSLGDLLDSDPERSAEAQTLWERAIAIDERLVIKDPTNRAARLELSTFCTHVAALLSAKGSVDEADRRSRMALGLLDSLTRVPPSLAIARADAHTLRGLILQGRDPQEALLEYEEALDLFEPLLGDRDVQKLPDLHERFVQLVLNLAAFPKGTRASARAQQLLSRGAGLYAGMAGGIVASGSRAVVQQTVDGLTRLLPTLPETEQPVLDEPLRHLQRRLTDNGAR